MARVVSILLVIAFFLAMQKFFPLAQCHWSRLPCFFSILVCDTQQNNKNNKSNNNDNNDNDTNT
jgi:hypothetical protein